jgi:Na+-driven multidrug efflux pump
MVKTFPTEVSHRRVLGIAVPIMLANVSQPLLGIVDTAVIGRLPEPHYIGAIAIGSLIFNFLYWGFGFLRTGRSAPSGKLFRNRLTAAAATPIVVVTDAEYIWSGQLRG